jgi:hypothetical protein
VLACRRGGCVGSGRDKSRIWPGQKMPKKIRIRNTGLMDFWYKAFVLACRRGGCVGSGRDKSRIWPGQKMPKKIRIRITGLMDFWCKVLCLHTGEEGVWDRAGTSPVSDWVRRCQKNPDPGGSKNIRRRIRNTGLMDFWYSALLCLHAGEEAVWDRGGTSPVSGRVRRCRAGWGAATFGSVGSGLLLSILLHFHAWLQWVTLI